MNLVDAYVTEVMGEPYYIYEKWWVNVKYNSYGWQNDYTSLMFNTKEEADKVSNGFHFLT